MAVCARVVVSDAPVVVDVGSKSEPQQKPLPPYQEPLPPQMEPTPPSLEPSHPSTQGWGEQPQPGQTFIYK